MEGGPEEGQSQNNDGRVEAKAEVLRRVTAGLKVETLRSTEGMKAETLPRPTAGTKAETLRRPAEAVWAGTHWRPMAWARIHWRQAVKTTAHWKLADAAWAGTPWRPADAAWAGTSWRPLDAAWTGTPWSSAAKTIALRSLGVWAETHWKLVAKMTAETLVGQAAGWGTLLGLGGPPTEVSQEILTWELTEDHRESVI